MEGMKRETRGKKHPKQDIRKSIMLSFSLLRVHKKGRMRKVIGSSKKLRLI
jgi:hypothetical protein